MKKVITCITLLVCCYTGLRAQMNDNCINAITLCSSPSFTFFANSGPGSIVDFTSGSNISNPVNNPFPPNSGCLKQGELNPQWLLITVGNAGLLEFVFGAGNSPNPQAGCYDWAMWPYSPTTCADILNNTLPPIRCNWNATCNNGTGIASPGNIALLGGDPGDFEPPLAVNACQQFVICISNYSGVNTLVSFQSLGSASLSCSPNCNPNYTVCYGSTATIVPVNFAALASPVYSIEPGGQSNTTGSLVVSPSVTTSYTTYITGTNQMNAVQTITSVSTVTVFPQPLAAPTVTNMTCTSTLNAVDLNPGFSPPGSSGTYSVAWSPVPNGVQNSSQTSFTGGIVPGAYQATLTSADGCTTTTGFTVDPQPDPAVIVLNPPGAGHTVTCFGPVTVTAMNPAYNYTWSSLSSVFNGSVAVFTPTMTGTWELTAVNPVSGCIATRTIEIGQNLVAPQAILSPTLQQINCQLSSVTTITAIATPSVNVTHQVLSPLGGSYSFPGHNMIYTPGGPGTYTHCVVNDANGCKTCTTFTLASSVSFPTYSITSPNNFSLGCNSTSCAVISIDNAQGVGGGGVTYTVLPPGASTVTSQAPLSGASVYTVCAPGPYTVITKDNTNHCETRTPVSILSNTFQPDISALVPRQILDCYEPSVILRGQSLTTNIQYLWSFPGTPGNLQSDTITIHAVTSAPGNSLVANYTLTITDNSSTCKSTSVIPVYQNLYVPNALVSPASASITCKTPTVILTNQSSTSIPPGSIFPRDKPVSGYLWEGPSPQQPEQLKTTYLAAVPGIYTLTVRDMNNGCLARTTMSVVDFRSYPNVSRPESPPVFPLECGAASRTIAPLMTGSTTGFTYSWTAAPGASVSGAESPVLRVNKEGMYRVRITNTVTGCAASAEVFVVSDTLRADMELYPQEGIAPLQVTFYNNSASGQGADNITSYWSYGNGTSSVTSSDNLSPVTTYSLPGTYKVTMYAVKGSCLDTVYKYVKVEIPSSLEIPNVFTPNGDGVNDLFFVKAKNLAEIQAVIFDRWGNVVYEVSSLTGNIEWDGKNSQGREVADGTYFYTIRALGKDNSTFDKKGTVSLYR
jgi:gliding motility-associated-like protein